MVDYQLKGGQQLLSWSLPDSAQSPRPPGCLDIKALHSIAHVFKRSRLDAGHVEPVEGREFPELTLD